MTWNNSLTQLLYIDYPIVQAPMLGVSTPEMAAAASNAGALGSLAIGGLSPETAQQLIRKVKALTNKPFAVNLFAHPIPDQFSIDEFSQMNTFLEQLCKENGVPYTPLSIENIRFYSYKDQLDVLLEEKIEIVSFTFGILTDEEIRLLKSRGTILIATVTSVKEARLVAATDIDIITVQGIEAGGHRGTFLEHDHLPMVGLLPLLSQVQAVTNKPLLAAGGIYNKAGIDAILALGAHGAQIGSLFLASTESAAIESYKDAIQQSVAEDSILTQSFSGRWARGLPNLYTQAVDSSGISIPPYPVQNSLTAAIRELARKTNNCKFLSLWAGQNASKAPRKSTAEIIRQLVEGN
ncbi:nitronate monooxygenase [Cytophagaceae bacterium YF14B1]|uniref:Nitronate monooxygenase n=1 Tax=Xanthocytophaga flava TaxID=3048013 RepID=A0AAE3QQ90_9BACT|nr:nitronate monooxygenase [Xanthocytophaga flavus]MDJ1481225.1 nitronate monooxygenase [Xanthocytophaga flavus]